MTPTCQWAPGSTRADLCTELCDTCTEARANRWRQFTSDELGALAHAIRMLASPLLGTIPTEVNDERYRRLNQAKP